MIDHELRSKGLGGSDIGALLGLDPRRDPFAVYADKLGLVQRDPPNARMRVGKRFEQVIVQWYAEECDLPPTRILWSDKTLTHPERPWQIGSPDAFVLDADGAAIGLVDAKSVAWDQRRHWGDRDDPSIPDWISVQLAWYCSLKDLPWGDAAALLGGNELWIRRYHRDLETEKLLLETAEEFWRNHVLARRPPEPGSSAATAATIKKMFPSVLEPMRPATPEELELIERLRKTDYDFDIVNAASMEAENRLRLAIGAAEGLTFDGGSVSYRKNKDTWDTDWQAVATELGIAGNELLGMLLSNLQLSKYAPDHIESIKQKYHNLGARLTSEKRVMTRVGPRVLRRHWKD